MTYITTHHQFVIDEKHPTDIFDEMSNFFSLYTVTLDSFHQLSIGLTVPSDFDIDNNAKLHTSYQNFIKAVRYSIPDANVLPIKLADDDTSLGKGMLELMIQYHEGRMITAQGNAGIGAGESKPKFYQKILGVMLPSFDRTQEQDGLYPQRPEPVVPMVAPIPPQPVPVPVISQPAPVVAPQPIVPPQYQQPQYQPPQNPSIAQPQAIPTVPPVIAPMPQPMQQPTPPVTSQPLPQSAPINYLPKPNVSIKPYRELLTKAIVEQAILEQTKQDKSANSSNQPTPQTITEITLKSKDSLTTAMIETLFASFAAQTTAGQRAYDAIDLASYGLEELRPKLRQIGVAISDEAQFALNAKAKATAQDLETIRQGMVNVADIHLATQLGYSSASDATPNPQPTPTHPANANHLNIAINIKVSDSMGERIVKVREFPVVFSTQNTHAQSTKLIKIMSKQVSGEMFYLNEQDGQLLAKNITNAITLQRNGQTSQLTENAVLLPNDMLHIGQDVQITLLLN